MRSERNVWKNGEQRFGFYLTQLGFGQGFLSKNNMTALDHPNWLQLIFTPYTRLKLALKGQRFCDVTDIMKNATEELKRFSQ